MKEISKVFLTDMDWLQAREFLLHKESYVAPNYPVYYNFNYLLNYAEQLLGFNTLESVEGIVIDTKYSDISDINYVIQFNKSKDAYRPNVIIHPLLYVDLVNLLTNQDHWQELVARYKALDGQAGPHILCNSIPFELEGDKNKTRYALHFWKTMEQESIKYGMVYNHILHLDLTNFYGTIDIQTIAWALHGEDTVKAQRHNLSLLGNQICSRLQRMNYGSSIGIPQGNQVSDLLAELLMRYIDTMVIEALKPIEGRYKILRYRDDYRIFTHTVEEQKLIKKTLRSILQHHKLTLNSSKDKCGTDLIIDSIKEDKLYWIEHDPVIKTTVDWKNYCKNRKVKHKYLPKRHYKATVQKHLLLIKMFADAYPNTGQLIKALKEFEERIIHLSYDNFLETGTDLSVLLAITFKIVEDNPKVTDIGVKLISTLICKFGEDREEYLEYLNVDAITKEVYPASFEFLDIISEKLVNPSDNRYLEIWLQRLVVKILGANTDFAETYTRRSKEGLVCLTNDIVRYNQSEISLFDETWIVEEARIDWSKFIDVEKIESMNTMIGESELRLDLYESM
ncbi:MULTISPECIES: RNA-directed DNA polymerase [unclassified Veillonella]|uniref:RNA-directed DNA polymerase n=1 Tax=unclassified Veillonella TaxID=2630086 RepID=UPI000F8DB39A|nr:MULTISPECIES: RNA-directed DNA polymerase [unclassified Veillonella]